MQPARFVLSCFAWLRFYIGNMGVRGIVTGKAIRIHKERGIGCHAFVQKCGGNMGKLLILSFNDNEDDILNGVLGFLNAGNRTYNLSEHTIEQKLIFVGIIIDINHRLVYRNEKEIELTHIEFEILQLLARHPGKVFSKEAIYDVVWNEPYEGDYNVVMSHIRNIREKIEDNPRKPVYIQTVWGSGYRFNKNISSNQ